MAIYINYAGIKGDVTADGYKDHIAADSFQFGVGRAVTMKGGQSANRECSTPSFAELCITKIVDGASPDLLGSAYGNATEGKLVEIKFVKTGSGKAETYMTYKLTDCLVSGYSVSAAGEGEPSESITLSYSKLEVEFASRDAANKSKSPARTGYDISQQKKM